MATPYNPDTSNTPDVQVSPLSIKSLLTWSPRTCAHVMLWFDPASTSHLPVGYLSSDPAVVAQQVSFLKARGVDFALLQWYGTTAHPHNEAALAWKAECEKQGLNFAVGMDQGMFASWYMPKGTDVNAWAAQMMQYVAATFFTSPNYEKTADGRFFLPNFNWQAVTGLNAGALLAQYPQVAMLWEHSGGVSQPGSAGAFAWIGVSGTYDPQKVIENYTSSFLATTAKSVAKNPKLLIMGSLVRGFDDHNRQPGGDPTKSVWDPATPYRFADEKSGATFLNDVALYNSSNPKPQYLQLVTFNDYEEGTALERGIDSDVAVTLTDSNHVDLVVNGQVVMSGAAGTFDLNSLAPKNNQQFVCQAVAVGKPFFQNKLSSTMTTTATLVPAQTAQVPVALNTQVPVSVPVSGTASGLTVSGTVTVTVPIQQNVNVPVTITTQTIWS
jgi:hypothetical protein